MNYTRIGLKLKRSSLMSAMDADNQRRVGTGSSYISPTIGVVSMFVLFDPDLRVAINMATINLRVLLAVSQLMQAIIVFLKKKKALVLKKKPRKRRFWVRKILKHSLRPYIFLREWRTGASNLSFPAQIWLNLSGLRHEIPSCQSLFSIIRFAHAQNSWTFTD